MKALFIPFLLLFSVTTLAQTTSIEVNISNVKDEVGQMVISLYLPTDDFPMKPHQFFEVEKKGQLTDGKMTYTLEDIPVGKYAIVLLDDTNRNLDMDRKMFGIPKEGYGFSNDAKPKMMTPPNFEACSFDVQEPTSVHITTVYW